MGNFFRNIGFAVLVIILTTIIFLLVVKDSEVKQSVIENSLGLLGDQLFAMVPESEQKHTVKQQYDRFMERVTNQEVAPEQVEIVAATILNVSNTNSFLTPEQAEAIFATEQEEPEEPAMPEDTVEIVIFKEKMQSPPPPAPPAAPEKWENLGKRIRSMCEINEDLQQEFRQNKKMQQVLRRQVRYQARNGLKLAMDTQLQARMKRGEFRKLQRELEKMEREKTLVWHENFEAEMESLHLELEKLEELKKLEHLKHLQHLEHLKHIPGLEVLKSLKMVESLKVLEVLETLEGVPNADSIREIVKESLREAAVEREEE